MDFSSFKSLCTLLCCVTKCCVNAAHSYCTKTQKKDALTFLAAHPTITYINILADIVCATTYVCWCFALCLLGFFVVKAQKHNKKPLWCNNALLNKKCCTHNWRKNNSWHIKNLKICTQYTVHMHKLSILSS